MAWVRKGQREGEKVGFTIMQESCLQSPGIELDPHNILLSENQKPMAKGNSGLGGLEEGSQVATIKVPSAQ